MRGHVVASTPGIAIARVVAISRGDRSRHDGELFIYLFIGEFIFRFIKYAFVYPGNIWYETNLRKAMRRCRENVHCDTFSL